MKRSITSRDIVVFCDKDTQTAFIRIFKYRNYLWAGGKVFELKKNSPLLEGINKNIIDFSVNDLGKDFSLWQEDNEKAITYSLDMSRTKNNNKTVAL